MTNTNIARELAELELDGWSVMYTLDEKEHDEEKG